MSVLSEIYSPTTFQHRRRTKKNHMTKVRLALSQVAVQYRKKNNKHHQENVRRNLKVVQDFIINTPKSKPLVLGINTQDLVQDEEQHDLAILHLRSPMLNGSTTSTTKADVDGGGDDERNTVVIDSYQLLMPRYSFSGNERKQHFFLDVMDTTNTNSTHDDDVESKSKEEEEEEEEEEINDDLHDETKYNEEEDEDESKKRHHQKRRRRNKKSIPPKQNHLQFTLNYKPEISLLKENDNLSKNSFWNTTLKNQYLTKKKKLLLSTSSFNNLTIDTSININLDEERFFKEANRFNKLLRPQKLDFGFETFLQELEDEDEKCEQLSNQILNEISSRNSRSIESKIAEEEVRDDYDEKESGSDEEEDDVDIIIVDEMEDINYDYLHGEDEAYPGQRELFEEMRLMEIRRIKQENEIQRLIMNAKKYAENEVKNICLYLQNQLQATQLALEEAERQRAELLARNMNKKKKKEKEEKT